jgi:hypothetical protein
VVGHSGILVVITVKWRGNLVTRGPGVRDEAEEAVIFRCVSRFPLQRA